LRQIKKIAQDNIYIVQKFAYVQRVIVISLFLGKNTRCGSTNFLSQTTHQNPKFETMVFISHKEDS